MNCIMYVDRYTLPAFNGWSWAFGKAAAGGCCCGDQGMAEVGTFEWTNCDDGDVISRDS
jgi:hypothetical protein